MKVARGRENLDNAKIFVDKILYCKIDNIHDAKKEYLKKIAKNKEYLDKVSTTSVAAIKIKSIFNDLEYAVFGIEAPKELDVAQGEKSDTDTDSESEKPDVAQGGKSDTDTDIGEADRQQRQELKILTPQQMITRLPILLAQLKSENNSQKLKNEIRQIVYSLYRSKNLSKTIYNRLMDTI